jgi:hypothetical protein
MRHYRSRLESAGVVELVLITFLSLSIAVIAAALALGAMMFITYEFGGGDFAILLIQVIPVLAAILAFIVSLKRLRAYMSN